MCQNGPLNLGMSSSDDCENDAWDALLLVGARPFLRRCKHAVHVAPRRETLAEKNTVCLLSSGQVENYGLLCTTEQ